MDKPTYSAADRARLVEECKASGLTIAAFAVKHNIPKGTLYQWVSNAKRGRKPFPIARVIPVGPPASDRQAKPQGEGILLEVDVVRIRVAPGFDAPTLASILRVVREGGQ